MVDSPAGSSNWLTLREACKLLNVSPGTMRQWADTGKVQSFRTPGGHRRFRLIGLEPTTAPSTVARSSRQMEILIENAVGRARLDINSGRVAREPWHRAFDGSAREEHRRLGGQLMALLLDVLRGGKGDAALASQARRIGIEYARVNLRQGTKLTDTLSAFLFFRDHVLEGLVELSAGNAQMAGIDSVAAYRRLNRFANTMLLTIVDSYTQEKRRK